MVFSFKPTGINSKIYNNARAANKKSSKINIIKNLGNELSNIRPSRKIISINQATLMKSVAKGGEYKFTKLTKQEQNCLVEKAKSGDLIARNTLWMSSYGLVYWLAKRIIVPSELAEDCVQEGMLAIPDAIKNFDSSRNCRFSTYLVFHIFKRMQKLLADQRFFLKYPTFCYVFLMKYLGTQGVFAKESDKEFIRKKYNIENMEDISCYPKTYKKAIILSTSFQENNFNFVGCEDDSHKIRDLNDVIAYIEWGMNKVINKKEKQILRLYFGFDGPKMNLRQIAAIYDVCHERIRQLVSKSCQRLKDYLENKNIF